MARTTRRGSSQAVSTSEAWRRAPGARLLAELDQVAGLAVICMREFPTLLKLAAARRPSDLGQKARSSSLDGLAHDARSGVAFRTRGPDCHFDFRPHYESG